MHFHRLSVGGAASARPQPVEQGLLPVKGMLALYVGGMGAKDRNFHKELIARFGFEAVQWILDDAPLFNPLGQRYASPREVLQVYKDEFDVAYQEGTVFVLTMHPHYIGHRSRIVILRELIEYIRGHEGAWFGTHEAAVRWVREQAGM